MNNYLVFRNGRLVSIVESLDETFNKAIEADYVVENPQSFEKQRSEWMERNKK
jgi:hypothetical protein